MNHSAPNRSFYTAVAVMLIACFLPPAFTNWLGGRLGELTIPVSAPLSKLSMMIRAVPERLDERAPQIIALEAKNKEQESRIYQLESRLAQVKAQLERLQGLQSVDPSFRYVTASRVAESLGKSDLFKVGLGSSAGVRVGSLALYEGYQLVGRVSAVSPRSSTITPITSRAFGSISALVIAEDGVFENSVACTLEPTGDGAFIGDIGKVGQDEHSPVSVGQRVVYREPDLRQLNTGPIIGVIEEVVPKDQAPLFVTITVRTEVNLDDIAVVDLKIPRSGASDGGEN